ncbi:pseudouridine synthase [Clostridium tarantellae]|uniref:Pseudouridine synthase n=1 Tax=Clostridium tarantellae TaxID=39493 RepID=A0A6I1MPE4_9CLOT|nr:pseudouridine synthase [Clostridium tarantellae]MPQ44102.1 pseudouridine synthase [Clostridium tarantellae]
MRINKLLSNLGICSRKEANRLIEANRVIVNGINCMPGQWVEESDKILIDKKPIVKNNKIYIILNKPAGIICTSAKEIENNIITYMNYPKYIFPVGRLDKDSQGLILMTNDGELTNKILKSENEHEKEYIVTVDKDFDETFILKMSQGVDIGGIKTKPCKISKITNNTFKIILTQGLNRQIRKMSKAFGYTVTKLERVRIMNIKIDKLKIGHWRELSKSEVEELINS